VPIAIVYLVACYENKAENNYIIASPINKVSIYQKKKNPLSFEAFFSCLSNVTSNASVVAATVVIIVTLFRLIEKEKSSNRSRDVLRVLRVVSSSNQSITTNFNGNQLTHVCMKENDSIFHFFSFVYLSIFFHSL